MINGNSFFNAFLLGSFFSIFQFGCEEKNPSPNEENELITTVALYLTDSLGQSVSASWRDLTPNDDAGRTIDTLVLKNEAIYNGTIKFLDESKSPVLNLTDEIKSEAKDHLVVYKAVSPLTDENIVIVRTDKDANNLEVGLSLSIEAKKVGTGPFRILLRHQPGEKNGTEVPGDSDVDVEIPVKIR